MQSTNEKARSFQGMDTSSAETLCGCNARLSSSIKRTKEWQLKNDSDVAGCSSGARLSAAGGSVDACVEPPPACGAAQSVARSTEGAQEGSGDIPSATKCYADDANTLTDIAASAQSSISFAPPTSANTDESGSGSRGSSACSGGCRVSIPQGVSSQLRKALESCTMLSDGAISDEPVLGVLDKRVISELLLQQRKGGVCVSLECADETDEEGTDDDRKAIVLTAANSSSFSTFSGNRTTSGNMSPACNITALFSTMLNLASSCDGRSGSDKKDDDASSASGFAVQLSGGIVETVSKVQHHVDMLGLLRNLYIGGKEDAEEVNNSNSGGGGGGSSSGSNGAGGSGGDGKRNSGGGEDECGDYESLDNIQKIVDKINALSLNTIKELASWWGIRIEEQEKSEFCSMSIAEQFCLISITILAVVSDRLDAHLLSLISSGGGNQCKKCNHINGNANGDKKVCSDAADGGIDSGMVGLKEEENVETGERVRSLFLSLRQDVRMLGADHMRCLATMFGFLDCFHIPEDVFLTISALGVLAFFSPLPVQLLETVCRELSIYNSDEIIESADLHHLPAMLAEKISYHFYSLRHPVPSIAKLPFMPQMQIHEHAPGRYTCTVDNANFLKVLLLHRLASNRFSCNKIHWYALLTVFRDKVSFFIWHRHSSSLFAKIVIRTQDPKKKRKNNSLSVGTNESLPNLEAALRESSALFLEHKAEVAPGELIGFESFVTLPVALSSLTTSQSGYRLYSSAEDRLVFQCALDLSNPDGTPLAVNYERKKSTSNSQKGKAATSTKQPSSLATETSTGGQQTTQATTTTETREVAKAEDEKRLKEFVKAVGRLEKAETRDRNVVEQSWSQGYRQLMNEHGKSYQKALQKAKDRERKLLLAKVGPSPELQRELEVLTQAVLNNRSQVTKLAKAKLKEEEAIKKLREQIDEGNKELERLRQQLKSGDEVLAGIEAETAACAARVKESEEARRRKQRELAAALRISDLSATRHETLAINDLQSFWSHPFANGTSLSAVAPAPSLRQKSPSFSQQLLPASESSGNSSAPALTSASSILPLRSGVLSSSGGGNGGGIFSSQLQTAAGGAVGASAASTWGPLGGPLPFSTTNMPCDCVSGAFDLPQQSAASTFSSSAAADATRLLGADGAGGQAATQTSSGFTVTAPFATSNAIPRFALDAKARPFTPTTIATPQAACNSAPRTGFTVNTGVTNLSSSSSFSASPMAGVSGNSTALGSSLFPERPRYTSVSTPVTGGFAGCGLFDTETPQNTISLFSQPGLSNGPASLTLESGKGLSLNFTTAPWN